MHVYRTEVIKNTLNPNWKPFSIPVQSFCGGDPERKIKARLTEMFWRTTI